MKKVILTIAAILVAAAMIFAFAGCGDKAKTVVDELSTGADKAATVVTDAVSNAAESVSESFSEAASAVF